MEATFVKSWEWREERFRIRDYLQERQYLVEEVKKAEPNSRVESDTLFNRIKKAVVEHFNERFEKSKDHEKTSWLSKQHEAIIGLKSAIDWFKREIEEYLRRNNQLGITYPSYYSDIVEALYQETYGLGPISTWWKHESYQDSQAARIIGTNIYFEIPGTLDELQDISYASEADVLRVAKQLSLRNPITSLNAHNPSLQIDMADGTRVTIIIPPWTRHPIIIFRHYTIKRVSLEDISQKGTFPVEMVDILRTISKGRGTTMLCGPVKSGKSTLLSAMIAERKSYDKMLLIQKDFDELKVSEHYPKNQVMEFILTEENKERIFDLVLRSDYEYIVVGELRSLEAEIFLKACERGLPGALTTYHTPDPDNIPSQLADVILDEHANKTHQAQYERAAKNVHFAIVMEELKNRSKRLVNLSVFDWDSKTKTFQTHELVAWNRNDDTWQYSDYIPKRVLTILERYAPSETAQMQKLLANLSLKHPIKEGVE